MTETESGEPEKHSYDVDWFREVFEKTHHKRGRLGKIAGKVGWTLGSFQGAFVIFMAPAIIFGTVFTIVYTLSLGPFVFLGTMAILIGGLTLIVEKKAGRSLQFGEYPLLRRTLGGILGYSLALGFILFLLYLGKIPLPHLP